MPTITANRPRTVTSSNVDNSPAGDAPPSGSNPPASPPPPADTFESSATTRQLKKAERALTRAGHDSGNVDGRINDKTRKALKDFQKGTGLPVTGELDERTFNKLTNLSDKLQEPGGKKTFRPGMKSDVIKDVEKRLRRLGYAPGPADGLFTPATASAVTELKKDQGNKNRSGSIGEGARKELRQEVNALGHKPRRARVEDNRANKRADKAATRAVKRGDGIGIGSTNESVSYLKRHLAAAGYDPKSRGDTFDERTEGMVKEFQRKSDLPVTGVVNLRTWKKLRNARMEADNATSPSQRVGEQSAAVKRSEKLLKKAGFNPGAVDGLYTTTTQRALDRLRKRFKLGGRGNGINQKTLQNLRQAADGLLLPPGQKVTGYVSGTPRTIRVVNVDGKKMERSTAKAWLKMKRAASKDGISLQLNSGWRSNSEQAYLYNGYIQGRPGFNLAAPPGYSNHQSGAAVDIQVGLGSSAAVGVGSTYNWLANNAPRFGFKRIAAEAWHWEFQPLLRKYGG